MSVCLFIVSGKLRCGAFKTFCDCPYQSRKAGTFTCRSRRWVTFHLPKPTTGASRLSASRQTEFSPQRPTRTRFRSPQSAKARFSLQRSASINFQPAKVPTFGSGKARFSPVETVKNSKRQRGQKAAALTAGSDFRPYLRKQAFACFFGEISDCPPPENFRQAEKADLPIRSGLVRTARQRYSRQDIRRYISPWRLRRIRIADL